MKPYAFIFANIALTLWYIRLLRHQTHMFQQNSYMYKRYARWYIKNNRKKELFRGLPGLLAVPALLLGYASLAYFFLGIYFLILFLLNDKSEEKKKLVYTKRVIRLLSVAGILLAINLLFSTASYFDAFITDWSYAAVLVLLACFPQIIVVIANAIILPVENTINGWYVRDAARKIDKFRNLRVVGITGSYGKTSTKLILYEILRLKFGTLATPESYNTTLGVVRTVREMLTPLHEVFIAEMGAKKRWDIAQICDIVKPQYGIITSIGLQHLETFGTQENIARTKMELFDSIPSYGTGFVNKDDHLIMEYVSGKPLKLIFYSMKTKDCDYYLHEVSHTAEGVRFMIRMPDGYEQEFRTRLLGKHNQYNILAAVCVAHTLGMAPQEISARVSELRSVPHRLELRRMGDSLVIDDAYNSNPEGAREALLALASFSDRRRILITPGMVELGEKQDELNMEFGKQAAHACDYIILVGEKQTAPILRGITEAEFNMDKCFTVHNLREALLKLENIKSGQDAVLFENDLPDIYE